MSGTRRITAGRIVLEADQPIEGPIEGLSYLVSTGFATKLMHMPTRQINTVNAANISVAHGASASITAAAVIGAAGPIYPQSVSTSLIPVNAFTQSGNNLSVAGLTYGRVKVLLDLTGTSSAAAAPTFPATATQGSASIQLSCTDNLGSAYAVLTSTFPIFTFGGALFEYRTSFEVFIPYNALRTAFNFNLVFFNNLTGADNTLVVGSTTRITTIVEF